MVLVSESHSELSPASRDAGVERQSDPRIVLGSLFVAALVLMSACLVSVGRFGSITAGIAWLNGESLVSGTSVATFDKLDPGATYSTSFRLQNLTAKPVTLLGADTGCSCLSVKELPLVIPPYSRHELTVAIRPDASDAGTTVLRTFDLLSDCREPLTLGIQFYVSGGKPGAADSRDDIEPTIAREFLPLEKGSGPSEPLDHSSNAP